MLINEFLKLLPFEMTAGEFIALILSVSIIIGAFETCHHQAQKAEEFYQEKNRIKFIFLRENQGRECLYMLFCPINQKRSVKPMISEPLMFLAFASLLALAVAVPAAIITLLSDDKDD